MKKSTIKLSELIAGDFFMFDEFGDVLCRAVRIRPIEKDVQFIGVGRGSCTVFKQSFQATDMTVFLLAEEDVKEMLKKEFTKVVRQWIQNKLTAWEVSIFVSLTENNGTIPDRMISELMEQQIGHGKAMETILGLEANNILHVLQPITLIRSGIDGVIAGKQLSKKIEDTSIHWAAK